LHENFIIQKETVVLRDKINFVLNCRICNSLSEFTRENKVLLKKILNIQHYRGKYRNHSGIEFHVVHTARSISRWRMLRKGEILSEFRR